MSRRFQLFVVLATVLITCLTVAVIVDTVVVVGLGTQVTGNQQADTSALCALRNDLQQRVNQSNDFLAKHPKGFAGIPAATIRATVNGQQRTIDALRPVPCPK